MSPPLRKVWLFWQEYITHPGENRQILQQSFFLSLQLYVSERVCTNQANNTDRNLGQPTFKYIRVQPFSCSFPWAFITILQSKNTKDVCRYTVLQYLSVRKCSVQRGMGNRFKEVLKWSKGLLKTLKEIRPAFQLCCVHILIFHNLNAHIVYSYTICLAVEHMETSTHSHKTGLTN